jgi:F-type H+-transporting ATPase subunit a
MDMVLRYGLLVLGAALGVGGWFWRRSVVAKGEQGSRKQKIWSTVLLLAGIWCFTESLLGLIFGTKEAEEFSVSIWADRVQIGNITLSATVLVTWAVMAVLLILAVLIRVLVVPRMTDKPHGVQNVLEICVESICQYTNTSVGDLGDNLPSYLFTVALFMVGCAAVELLGIRAPTADITMTFALALITFVLINYYGVRRKGVGGRIRSMAQPTPVVFPIKVVSDCAVPVSLACRLFGNMLGGMIVMDLLYSALGNAAIGIPSVVGLYFNVFHPLIQTYIFITLTLTFIREATE